jgi:hypothetical protein
MSASKWVACFALAATIVPTLHGEPRCPGNVASIRFRLVHDFQIIVPVRIDHFGPYDFLVDTGTQLTMIDPLLAAELKLRTQDSVEVVGLGLKENASLGQVALIETGSHTVANHRVLVQNLERLRPGHLRIRGILGGDFLGHFDVLIDYAHKMLCLDEAKTMQADVKGEHIALVVVPSGDELPLIGLPIIPVHLSGVRARPLLLVLDSGTNSPFLYNPARYWTSGLSESTPAIVRDADEVEQAFSVLPPQKIDIGSTDLEHVSFIAPARSGGEALTVKVDGMLTTTLFERLFISYVDRFVVLDPRY